MINAATKCVGAILDVFVGLIAARRWVEAGLGERNALAPVFQRLAVGPAGLRQPPLEVVERAACGTGNPWMYDQPRRTSA